MAAVVYIDALCLPSLSSFPPFPSLSAPSTLTIVLPRLSPKHITDQLVNLYRMAGNIGGKFNLAVWRMSGQSDKLKSTKHSAHGDFDDLVLHARQIIIRHSSKNKGKWQIRQILFQPIFPTIQYIVVYYILSGPATAHLRWGGHICSYMLSLPPPSRHSIRYTFAGQWGSHGSPWHTPMALALIIHYHET